MVSLIIPNGLISNPILNKKFPKSSSISMKKPIICFESQTSKFVAPYNFFNKLWKPNSTNKHYSIIEPPKAAAPPPFGKKCKDKSPMRWRIGDEIIVETKIGVSKNDYTISSSRKQMLVLCGLGYWVQGFRCFPWLALNFHMAQNLNYDPSTLQWVQYCGILPMVAKPFYGILSDALYIGAAHRIPYICIGVILQVFSWGPLSLIPFVGEAFPTLMACVLLSNLGAAVTEVSQDALIAEYGQKHKIVGLQSYTFMAIAVAGILGNSLGGILLSKSHPRTLLLIFTLLLSVQLLISISTKEESLGLSKPLSTIVEQSSSLSNIKRQFSDLLVALSEDKISRPLLWVVASIAMVPMLTGSIFCYQTQSLNLDPSIIGVSKVIGQMLLLSLTVLYDRFWKNIPIRKLIGIVQFLYAFSLLLDLVLVTQINLKFGIPNNVFALCFSGLAETIATFKTVPFFVLIGSLCPSGCEASVTAFLASALTLSTIVSGFLGIGLASVLGITSDNYTSLSVGIMLQSLAALVPLAWINNLPISQLSVEKEKKKGRSKRSRKNRRVGRVTLNSIFSYRRKRESETQR
ncbi:probable folate-biopterin transporter 9, chloroplastic isoform X1 [Chenopodium quinoa]|uniref:probable folate-biopterin transporter 9, chloroplastic isoform X1 n=1 Tax=Chenopodium quinoa TaxID=63459 RepID=UPI000B79A8DA|nr:probable folate-biopterin transporter 9, chloroplastic isoform X1 [Chenopodium quinoa]